MKLETRWSFLNIKGLPAGYQPKSMSLRAGGLETLKKNLRKCMKRRWVVSVDA
jgi:hypothetical protein